MTTYAPQPEPVSTRVGPPPPTSIPQSSHAQPTASGASTVAYVPPSAIVSSVHHHTPLQPNRLHPLPDSSWHDHHPRLKGSLSPRLLPPPSQPPQLPSHHVKRDAGNPESQSVHHSHTDNRRDNHSSYGRGGAPETPYSYRHPPNVVAPHHPGSRLTAPPHHPSYLYPVHQLVTPVAHVPIGAAHYAHLPPSIWSPPHGPYHPHPFPHPHPHPQAHHIPPPHHLGPAVVSTPHGQLPYATSRVHHVAAPTHPPTHAYALPPPHTAAAPHPPPHGPPHAVHPGHHPQQHVTYTYAQVPTPPPSHHALKTTVAVSSSQPVAVGVPVSYSVPPPQQSQATVTAVSAPLSCKTDPLPHHTPHAQLSPPRTNGIREPGEREMAYDMNGNRHQGAGVSSGTEDRTDTSSPRPLKNRPVLAEDVQTYRKVTDQRKESNQKETGQQPSSQPIRKPRKPYTIKKSREVWTPEEHSRFLQALQLYDRDWKKIESYIGTKTVLQIRSHAQKHFGKVAKYKTGEYIPPPRPKKRAALPYPRSRSAGQNRSYSTIGSTGEKLAGSENDSHSRRDPNAKNRIISSKTSTDGNQGTVTPNGTISGITQSPPVAATNNHPNQHIIKPPQGTAVEANERHSGSNACGEKYSSSCYDRQNDSRNRQGAHHRNHPQTNDHIQWNSGPPHGEPCREQVPTAQRASSSSTDIKTGLDSYTNDPYVHRRDSSSYSDDLGRRDVQYDRSYRRGPGHTRASSDNNSASQRDNHHSPKRLSPRESNEHDNSLVNGVSRRNMSVSNNSLLVLSNCVDLMSRETLPERQPAAGWATAAAARRAHRAKVMRARKPPLPQPTIPAQMDDQAHGGKSSPRREMLDPDMLGEQCSGHTTDRHIVVKGVSNCDASPSPPVTSPSEYGSDQSPPDLQRISPSSGAGSDEAIAGFSSSDRPSVSGSATGSGTGVSPETSDAGDPEEDPKSSNDGSGDDGNRRSPPTRNLSPADPTSSGAGSRENSPNDCRMPQRRNDASGAQIGSPLQKAPEKNALSMERYERISYGDKTNADYKRQGSETVLNEASRENGRYDGHLQGSDRLEINGEDRKSHALLRPVHSVNHGNQMALHGTSPQDDRGSQLLQHAVHKLSPSANKRLRPGVEYDIHRRKDGRIGKVDRDSEAKRQRMMHSIQKANYGAEQPYHCRDFAERHR